MSVFHKFHGTGNDFIIIDNRNQKFTTDEDIIKNLCHRRFGIGADGLILLENSDKYDFSMRYFNSDGREGSMCGNGGRCISAFAQRILKLSGKICFTAVDGVHHAEILKSSGNLTSVKLKMADVTEIHQGDGYYFLDTGSPHHVVFVNHVDEVDVVGLGRKIRYSQDYPRGTNVDFVEIKNGKLLVLTYERGVEDETLSCGTGVTAAALAASLVRPADTYDIVTKGGNLRVSFTMKNDSYTDIWLEGPVTYVFDGEIII